MPPSETVDTKGRPVSTATIDMSGARKAALLLVSIGHERAARILQSLSEVEVERVMTEIANLGPVDEALVNHVMKEFVSQAHRQNRVPQGGIEVAKELLSEALGSSLKADAVLARIGGTPAGSHFRALPRGPRPQRGRFSPVARAPPDDRLGVLQAPPRARPGHAPRTTRGASRRRRLPFGHAQHA